MITHKGTTQMHTLVNQSTYSLNSSKDKPFFYILFEKKKMVCVKNIIFFMTELNVIEI